MDATGYEDVPYLLSHQSRHEPEKTNRPAQGWAARRHPSIQQIAVFVHPHLLTADAGLLQLAGVRE
jgi:hypothetical protein